ncbi:MAG: extracellular solute-binding protein [Oscillospiraceae bacterium]
MKRQVLRLLAVLLCGALLFVGCTPAVESGSSSDAADSSGSDSSTTDTSAKGRYVEEEYNLPEGIGYLNGFDQLSDGSFMVLGNDTTGTMMGNWHIWRSQDGCKSWQELSYPWLADMTSIMDAHFVSQDEIYLLYSNMSEEDSQKINELYETDEDAAMELYNSSIKIVKANESALEELPVSPFGQEQNGWTPTADSLGMTADGDLLLKTYFSIEQVEPDTGKVKNSFSLESPSMWGEVSFIDGDKLAIISETGVGFYNLSTGELDTELNFDSAPVSGSSDRIYSSGTGSSRIAAPDPSGDAVYFCDNTGLYRTIRDGSLTEKVIDGSLCSIGMPSITLDSLYPQEDGSFLVLVSGEGVGKRLLRYSYDPDIPTVPSTELRVYSLKENKTIRQAAGVYQLQNPDVKVTYEVGMSGDDGVTTSDALRALSTEVLAGSGPDVLVLDGLPADSYIEKGVLADLTGVIGEKISSGELLESVAHSYDREGSIYAVPARFQVPILGGPEQGFQSLSDMADFVEQSSKKDFGVAPDYMLDFLYPVLSNRWFLEDGSLNEETLREDLAAMDRIASPLRNLTDEERLHGSDIITGSAYYNIDRVDFFLGILSEVGDIAAPEQVAREKGEISFFPAGEGVFIPNCVLAVNAGSRQQDRALDFVSASLSADVLTTSFYDGLPVNITALQNQAKNPYSTEDDGVFYSFTYMMEDEETGERTEGEVVELQVKWPSDDYMQSFLEKLGTLKTPVIKDAVVMEMFLEVVAPFVTDGGDLDGTISALKEKLALYLAE